MDGPKLPNWSAIQVESSITQLKLMQTKGDNQFLSDTRHSTFIRTVSSNLLLSMYWYICFLPGCSWAEIKCTVHLTLPKRPINQCKLDRQKRQAALRAYCSNIYTVTLGANVLQHESVSLSIVTWSRANPNAMIKLFRSFYKFQKRYGFFWNFCFKVQLF